MDLISTDFENWAPYLMKQFQLMYEKGERCDLEISCNKQIFLVHRLIMSACSEYVKELGDKQHIILPEEVSCKALKTVLDFVYSGKIMFNKEEKDDLLLASNLLNMRLLSELIKMEESCSFTLSMDDEPDDKPEESANTEVTNDIQEITEESTPDQPKLDIAPNRMSYKRKSETKSNKSKSSRNTVLPPLHKFPYLQQKFSASRTYGLITTLTEPVPSRFEIPTSMPIESVYRSSFEDVSYETDKLCNEADTFAVLEPNHHQFIKKMKETSSHKRSYANALYSPFDKYTPPYTIHSDLPSRKRDAGASYLLKNESPPVPAKRPAPSSSKVTANARKPVTNNAQKTTPTNNTSTVASVETSSTPTPKSNEDSSIVAIDEVQVIPTLTDENVVPQAAPKSPEIIEVPSIENGEKVELIKLNNVVVRNVEPVSRNISEELPDVSISVIEDGTVVAAAAAPASGEATEMEIKDELPSSQELNATPIPEPELKEVPAAEEPAVVPDVISNVTQVTESAASPLNPPDTDTFEPENLLPDEASTEVENSVPAESPNNSTAATVETSLATAATVETSLATPDLIVESSPQFLALKTKGNESQAQLNKIIEDLRKKSPLLKDKKNIRFKIVSVKGPINEILKEQAKVGGNILNKAIIVKKTENATVKADSVKDNAENQAVKKPTASIKDYSIENVNGPWECKSCGESDTSPMKFGSYFDYRTHVQDVHSEPNNPVYCMYCGYKALKRNMQLYHLFVKHNVEPPSHFKFPKCDKCEFHALNEYSLQKHLSCHPSVGMEFVCSCKVAFKTSDALQKHIVSGDCKNSKSFSCGYCKNSFDRFVNLKAHMRLCMKERSKPLLQTSAESFLPEPSNKTITEGGKDYLAL